MYGNRFCTVIGALLIVIGAASCVPETEALLSDPSSAKVDQRLLGDWSAKDKSERVEVTFRRRDDGTMDLFWNEFKPGKILPTTSVHYRAWRTDIGGHSYLNLSLVAPRDKEHMARWTLASYEIGKGGALVFYVLDGKKLEKLIKAGALRGRLGTVKVPYDGVYVSIGRPVIAMPREKLVAFLRDKGRGSIFMKGASVLQRRATAPAPKN